MIVIYLAEGPGVAHGKKKFEKSFFLIWKKNIFLAYNTHRPPMHECPQIFFIILINLTYLLITYLQFGKNINYILYAEFKLL